ncbi:MAG: DUF86 domain-containing protein [Armatimonadota bacterium]|nr:DUF86 domain-containing protein [Armatimonadota bacterium]MDR7421866.1 DUF86 domain-containing protein [Armatimonadota bacterium]MDR7452893.1 DUF86 domain-containing protein [Armatimonadota bacterium]MDR7456203.1 DUF86 domain-containing protein [Armatimonadota bacterium]MDR7496371.1 DUF86 domain-containing protein [Armatimonadota bacterium]
MDRERILGRLDDIDRYLRELGEVTPQSFDQYQRVATRRACERLLQITVEAMIDVCAMLVAGLRLGVPGEEDDLFERLRAAGVLSEGLTARLRRMKGFRNILVHEYTRVDDQKVFAILQSGPADFGTFTQEVLRYLRGLPER